MTFEHQKKQRLDNVSPTSPSGVPLVSKPADAVINSDNQAQPLEAALNTPNYGFHFEDIPVFAKAKPQALAIQRQAAHTELSHGSDLGTHIQAMSGTRHTARANRAIHLRVWDRCQFGGRSRSHQC